MTGRQKFRGVCYVIEGVNSLAAVIYFNYLYFFFRDQFGFDNKHNLALAAFIGLVYTLSSWQGGRFAARFGYLTALKTGFGIMAAGLLAGSQLHSVAGAIAAACVINAGICLTWPTLEALVTVEAVAADAVGLYNVVWAAGNAVAYFLGGSLIEKLGYQSIFYIPLALLALQFALVCWLQKIPVKTTAVDPEAVPAPPDPARPSPARAQSFQRMAWLANPFAYLAINTLLAVIPGIAASFHLSPKMAGFTCSLWCFVRMGMFIVLWFWGGWHYRFRWLAGAYALLVMSFAGILTAPGLPVLILAQLFFGAAIGLIYYSSLFYSMDASGASSEHGGIHEAAIGLGNCLGPAVGAASLQFLPQYATSGAVAVSVLLLCGFGGLLAVWKNAR